MERVLLEICCESLADSIIASRIGADRIELNSGLRLGGLTPSIGLATRVCKHVDIPVIAMIRPRESGFCYSDEEFETMLEDARMLLSVQSSGIAFGILTPDGKLDMTRCSKLVAIAEEFNAETVLHRAFDFIHEWKQALDQCVDLGINRIMTSGGKSTAIEGTNRIREIIEYAADRIEVLPAAGINSHNVKQLVFETTCDQVHGSCSETILDPTIAFIDQSLVDIDRDPRSYRATGFEKARDLAAALKQSGES